MQFRPLKNFVYRPHQSRHEPGDCAPGAGTAWRALTGGFFIRLVVIQRLFLAGQPPAKVAAAQGQSEFSRSGFQGGLLPLIKPVELTLDHGNAISGADAGYPGAAGAPGSRTATFPHSCSIVPLLGGAHRHGFRIVLLKPAWLRPRNPHAALPVPKGGDSCPRSQRHPSGAQAVEARRLHNRFETKLKVQPFRPFGLISPDTHRGTVAQDPKVPGWSVTA